EPLRLSAVLPGARAIRFMHNARTLATIEGERGEAEIDTRRLGLGPVRILPVAHLPPQGKVKPSDFAAASAPPALAGGRVRPGDHIAGNPVDVEVVPPPALPPIEAPPEKKRHPGLKLTLGKGDAVRIEDKLHGNWLAKAGMTQGGGMTLDGYFRTPEPGLYQFQVRTGGRVTIEVDGHALDTPTPGRWTFLPVHLAEGTHRLAVQAAFMKRPGLDLRFGRRGTRPVGTDRFFCIGPFSDKEAAGPPAAEEPHGGKP
ncbi:MAG: hypothetical protein U9R68_02170, partial [Planctomycetota bacterium]|nr:hypothetical protein [Planctomycetota bacterium]